MDSNVESTSLSNGWRFNVSQVDVMLPREAVEEAIHYVNRWAKVFPHQGTWIGDVHGVPSFVVRVEGMYDLTYGWKIHEIEDRPCGLGAVPKVNPHFKTALGEILKEYPPMKWVMDPDRLTDDELWLGAGITLEQAIKSDGLLLVRSRPEKGAYHQLEHRAVSPVSREGDKRCLTILGLGTIIRWVVDPEDQCGGYISPPIVNSSVIKPLQGTRCRDVMVYLGNDVVYRKVGGEKVPHFGDTRIIKVRNDTVSLERLEKKEALCQPFNHPMRLGHLPTMNAIYRFYLGYSPSRKRYVPLGGVYNASTSLRVHGEDDVVFGPLNFVN